METAQKLTERNSRIGKKISESVNDLVVGTLMTGSNSWGADYAVNELSDIDLVIVAVNAQKSLDVVKRLVENEIVNARELSRGQLFTELHSQGKADVLSVKEKTSLGQLSIDIIPLDIVAKIVSLTPLREAECSGNNLAIKLRVLNEFRTNPPKQSGYSVDDLRSKRIFTYHPKFKSTKGGYIAESLIDSTDGSYYMGVYAFFFAVEPKIIADNNSFLADAIKTFQNNIKKLVNGTVVHVTREERMSKKDRNQIYQKLS